MEDSADVACLLSVIITMLKIAIMYHFLISCSFDRSESVFSPLNVKPNSFYNATKFLGLANAVLVDYVNDTILNYIELMI